MAKIDATNPTDAIAATAVAFGATAVVAPKTMASVFGLPSTPPMRLLTRMWGTRNIALGALALLSGKSDVKRRILAASVALCAVDTASAVVGGADLPARTRFSVAATTAAYAVAGGLALAGVLE